MASDSTDYKVPEHLKFKGNATRLGDKSNICLTLGELFEVSVRGFTPKQWAHVSRCSDCKASYGNYLKLRRAHARQQLNLSMKGVPLPDMDRLK